MLVLSLVILIRFGVIDSSKIKQIVIRELKEDGKQIILDIYKNISIANLKFGTNNVNYTDEDICWFEAKTTENEEKNSRERKAVSIGKTINTGSIISKAQIQDFSYMVNNFFIVDSSTYLNENEYNFEELASADMTLKQTNEKPQILIYHTHSQEGFVDSIEGDKSTSIVAVGDYLEDLLKKKGFNVIHDRNTYDLIDGIFDRNKAYDYARQKMVKILDENPSIEVVMDVHRDGVREDLHLETEINGKPTAKIMFFNGLSRIKNLGDVNYLYNPYLKDNLAFSLQMRIACMKYYPDFVRTNYLNAYKYNLDLRPKSLLVEVGAQTNTLEEEYNAMEPLADILEIVLKK